MKKIVKKLFLVCTAGFCMFTIACTNEVEPETPKLRLSSNAVNLGDTAAVFTVAVNSNINWIVRVGSAWIKASPEQGNGKESITVSVEENNEGKERSGFVEIVAGSIKERFTVSQSKTLSLELSRSAVEFDDTPLGDEVKFLVLQSDDDWTTETTADWINVIPTKGYKNDKPVTVTISTNMNSTSGVRSGEVIFKTTTRNIVFSVNQKKSNNLFYGSSDTIYLSEKSSQNGDKYYRKYRLTSSGAWTVERSNDWINIEMTEGSAGSYLMKVWANADNNGAQRTGKITFTSGSNKKDVFVVQGNDGNYWNDGDLKIINRHTKGLGVPMVMVGDGFDREDLKKGGWWEMWGTRIAKHVMDVEVLCDLKEYLDVYVLMSESLERGVLYPPYQRNKTKYNAYGFLEGEKYDAILADAIDAVNKYGVTDQTATWSNRIVRVVFMANGPYPGNASNPLSRMGVDEQSFDYWAIHEFVGHTLCDLPDMYWSGCGCRLDDIFKRDRDAEHAKGFDWWIDYQSDPDKVVWKDFIGKPGYNSNPYKLSHANESDSIGVFATTYGACWCENLWGPSFKTTMREWYLCWDLGSRYQIWNKIHERAGNPEGKYNNLEAFKEYDIKRYRCNCEYYKYNGRGTPYTWTKYNADTGVKKQNGDYDRFWQRLWPIQGQDKDN